MRAITHLLLKLRATPLLLCWFVVCAAMPSFGVVASTFNQGNSISVPTTQRFTKSYSGSWYTSYNTYPVQDEDWTDINPNASGPAYATYLKYRAKLHDQNWGGFCSWSYLYVYFKDGSSNSVRVSAARNSSAQWREDELTLELAKEIDRISVRAYSPYSGCTITVKEFEITIDYIEINDFDGDGVTNEQDILPFNDAYTTSVPVSAQPSIASPPADISDLKLWLDAKQPLGTLGTVSDQDVVSSWLDLSGNQHHADAWMGDGSLYQGANQSVRFTANEAHYLIPPFAKEDNYSSGEMFVLIKLDGDGDIDHDQFHNWSPYSQHHFNYSNGKVYENFGREYRVSFNPVTSLDQWVIYNVTSSPSEWKMLLNGKEEYNYASTSSKGVAWGGSNFIGGYGELFEDGEIREILFYGKALTADERTQVNQYLTTKWGMTGSVDCNMDGTISSDECGYVQAAVMPDFSETVDAEIGSASGLDTVEGNLALWLDASNINGQENAGLDNGDAISTWIDLSGNGNDASAVDASKVTLTKTSSLFNNESVIAFNEEGFTLANTVNPKNLFIVYKRTSFLESVPGYSDEHNYPRFFLGHSSTYDFHSGWHTYGAWSSIWTNDSDLTHPDILNGATYQNGTVINGQSVTFTDTGELLSIEFAGIGNSEGRFAEFNQIGKDRGSSTAAQNWLGDIAEIIAFNGDITDQQRSEIHAYLSQKWGLTGVVDSDNDGFVDAKDGAPTSVTDDALAGINFTNDHQKIDMGVDVINDGARTLSAWVKMPSAAERATAEVKDSNDDYFIITSEKVGDESHYDLLYFNNGTDLAFLTVRGSGSSAIIDEPFTLDDNRWHHVVVTVDSAGNAVLYADGVSLTSTTVLSEGIPNSNDVIGHLPRKDDDSSYSRGFYGHVDKVAIWDKALTAAEVAAIYNEGIDVTEDSGDYASASSLTVYYEFDSESGTNVVDLSGNSNNATLDGTSWATNQGVYTTVSTTGTRDTDGDGFTDAVEIAAGSLATDATSLPDTTAPTLTNVRLESNNSDTGIASNGDTVSVSFEASEAVDTPIISINGQSATVTAGSGANSYTATITVPNYKKDVSIFAGQIWIKWFC